MRSSQEKSLFSENTHINLDKQHSQASQVRNDQLFACYRDIMLNYGEEYPWLSKVLFLSLLINQSLLFFTNRKGQVRDTYETICQQLGFKPKIYHCNETTTVADIFTSAASNSKPIVLLFNTLLLDNKIANNLSPELRSHHVFDVQPMNRVIPPNSFLQEDFGMCVVDEPEDNFDQFIKHLADKKTKKAFESAHWQEVRKKNLEAAQTVKEEQGFMKVYLQLLKAILEEHQITFANSKWKSLLKNLKIVGMNKTQDKFKLLCLLDCVLAPWFIVSSVEQFRVIERVNDQVIMKIVSMYGVTKFSKNLDTHFWISQARKKILADKLQALPNNPTFFYPCNKYTSNVFLACEKLGKEGINGYHLSYRVKGYDKKLMSDKFIEIKKGKAYRLEMEVKTTHKMLMYLGLTCYDQNKKIISAIQICRRKNTEVVFSGLQDNCLLVEQASRQNLKNWISYDNQTKQLKNFAYLRSIGIYSDGNTDRILPIDDICYQESAAYQTAPEKGAYRSTVAAEGKIILNSQAAARLKQMLNKNYIRAGVTVLVNHFEAGTYVIGKVLHEHISEWTKCVMQFEGQSRESCHNKFLQSTKYVRVSVMSNFNSGYPEFHVQNKEAELSFGSIAFRQL